MWNPLGLKGAAHGAKDLPASKGMKRDVGGRPAGDSAGGTDEARVDADKAGRYDGITQVGDAGGCQECGEQITRLGGSEGSCSKIGLTKRVEGEWI